MRPRVCWQIVSHKTHHYKETKRNKRRWAGLWHNTTVRRSSEETGLISGAWICWSPLRLTWSCVFCLLHSPQGESTCSKSPMLILMPHMVSSNKSKLYLHRGFNGWTQASVCGTAIVSSENSPERRGDEKGGGVYCWTWKCRQMRKNWEQNTSTQSNRKSLVSSNADDERALQKKKKQPLPVFLLLDLQREQRNRRKDHWRTKESTNGAFPTKDGISINGSIIAPGGKPRIHFSIHTCHWRLLLQTELCCLEGSRSADCGGSQPCLQVWEPWPLAGSQRCPDGRAGGILFYFFPNHWHRLAHPSCCRRARGNKPPKNGYGGKFPPLWGGGL